MSLFIRYVLGLAVGVVVGLIFPSIVTLINIACVLAICVIVTEVIGMSGYGTSFWRQYRMSIYVLMTLPVLSIIPGALFGSGMVGHWLIALGTLLSR